MGFTTGFVSIELPPSRAHSDQLQLGGVTLTYSVLYLTIYLHNSNRKVQHTLLQQSASLLNATVDAPIPIPDPPPYEVKRAGLTEQLKDRWNTEIERMVQKVQATDWTEQREIYERKISNAWGQLKQTEQAKEIEQKVKETVDAVKGDTKDKVEEAKEKAKEKTKEPRLLDLK